MRRVLVYLFIVSQVFWLFYGLKYLPLIGLALAGAVLVRDIERKIE